MGDTGATKPSPFHNECVIVAATCFESTSRREDDGMVRKTMKTLVVALIAAFAMSSAAEAATPTKTKHRPKHSSRVASGAPPATTKKPLPKKPAASGTRAKASGSAQKSTAKKAPVKRHPSTKPH